MQVLIVEDEKRIARQLEKLVNEIIGSDLHRIAVCNTIETGRDYILNHTIDLLILDLNLNGLDGFSLLKEIVADSFHTVIVSAYTNEAIKAFEYGAIDFIAKPFNKERLEQAMSRFMNTTSHSHYFVKYLAVKKHRKIEMININDINYIQAAGHYSELHLLNGKKELHNKSLDKLMMLLPDNFERIHRSYAVSMDRVDQIKRYPGSKYELVLKDSTVIPCSRIKFKELILRLNRNDNQDRSTL